MVGLSPTIGLLQGGETMSYAEQLAKAVALHKALIYILDRTNDYLEVIEYPDFRDLLELLAEGCQRKVRTDCEDAPNGVCVITTTAGGISEVIGLLESVIEELTQEVDLGEITESQALEDTRGDIPHS